MRHKAKVMLAVLAHGNVECPQLGRWRALAAAWAATSPKVEDVVHAHVNITPTPVARHQLVKAARETGCDILFSVDGDTEPAEGFFQAAVETLIRCKTPSVIVAPYVCGGMGAEERVQVFRWRTDRTGDKNDLARLDHYPREEAAYKTGLEPVACAGTGCYAAHTEVFDYAGSPAFDYEYDGPRREVVVATEDVHFFRDLSAAGIQVICDWDHWATHYKVKAYGKPAVLSPDDVWGRTADLVRRRDTLAPEREPDRDGWFDYAPLYEELVRRCRPGGTIVEVGSFTGASFVHLAVTARASGKGVLCVSVDHGLGGKEPTLADAVKKMGGTTAGHLARRVLAHGLTEGVLQIVGTSERAARLFADGTLDAVFLDADHDEAAVLADVAAWWPKLIPFGMLAGHDWDRESVRLGLAMSHVGPVQSALSPSCWEAVRAVAAPRIAQDGHGGNGRTKGGRRRDRAAAKVEG